MPRVEADFVIVGGGIAGASIGYFLAPHGCVVILERESRPGYHSTGRSAAMVIDSYGPPQVRALTAASHAFFSNPPEGFCGGPLLAPRPVLMVGTAEQTALLGEHFDLVRGATGRAELLSAAQAGQLIPVLRAEALGGAVLEPTATDVDVSTLHEGFLRGVRACGGQVVTDAEVLRLQRTAGQWEAATAVGDFCAPVLINAAGAWCDRVAQLAGVQPIGLVPKRRTAFTFRPEFDGSTRGWPMCGAIDSSWYMKPDAGLMLGSPANADPVEPQDVQAEELDVALGIHNIQEATTFEIRRPTHVWAGLRSFVADGALVGGYDRGHAGFFWLAGQGGYGIQTSAAMGEACASIVRGSPLAERFAALGLTAGALGPDRLRRSIAAEAGP
jgi:D-arginine dehydrogenase